MSRLLIAVTIWAFFFGLATACAPSTVINDSGNDRNDGGSDSDGNGDDDDDNDDNDNDDDDTGDTDSDIDTDTDTDADTDTESDTDSESDDDTDKDTDCPQGSAYPCSCDPVQGELCSDGSSCIAPREDGIGACTWECSSDTDPVCDAGDWGIAEYGGVCGTITSDDKDYCGVICNDDTDTADCPPDLICTDITGGGVCTGS